MPSRTTFTVGRSRECDIVLGDDSVSRVHAELTLTDRGRLYLSDRASSHGTLVEDGGARRAITQQFVAEGDRVWFGEVHLTGAELLERARAAQPQAPKPRREAARSEEPRTPRWDAERGEIREDSGRRR